MERGDRTIMDIFERKHIDSERKHVECLDRFSDRLWCVETPNDLYEAALDTITCALGCSRASILLLDDTGVMRLASWRGMLDAGHGAVEGHAPWPRDSKNPQPVCIRDIEEADLTETLKKALRAEQIKALAFIPVVANSVLIGMLVTYYGGRHGFSDTDHALAIIIARQLGFNLERRRVEDALRMTQRQLESELAATQHLQSISTQLIHASDVDVLYEKILDAAMGIMCSDFASMQMFYPERGELRLLAYRGFSPTAATFWEWVKPASATTCGVALATGQRSIVVDIELSDFMAGSEDLLACRENGIRALQSTPLFSRAGRMLGMISTHWRSPHQPSERDLRLLDVLARQAADLIERKQTEVFDQRLAAIVDSSHDAIVSIDLNGRIASWNRGAERLFGGTSGEMIGSPITRLIPLDRHHEEDEILARIQRGERVDHYETVWKNRDGNLVDLALSVSPLRNAAGEVIGASKIALDITQRKKAELALAERTLQLALAERSALVGSVAYDPNSDKMEISEGYAAIHGFPGGSGEIARSEWLAGVHPQDLVRIEELRKRVFYSRCNEYSVEYRIVRPAGEIRWIEARIFVSYRGDGHPQRVVGINIDVTARKRAEEQERALRAELDHRVKNVLATVSAIAAHTKDASASMDAFVTALDNRIRSMAATHELLSSCRWQGVALQDLVRRELAPYASNSNTLIKGPEAILGAEAAQAIGMVLHELTTNAAKYGALSNGQGHVSVLWDCALSGEEPAGLVIEWLERGGPRVKVPGNSGYGRRVITELVPYELGGTARLLFPPEGVHCRLDVPAKWLAPASGPEWKPPAADVSAGTIGNAS